MKRYFIFLFLILFLSSCKSKQENSAWILYKGYYLKQDSIKKIEQDPKTYQADIDKDNFSLVNLRGIYYCLTLKNYKDAIKDFDRGIQKEDKEENIPFYRHNKSVALLAKKENQASLNEINKAIEVKKDEYGFYYQRGNVYYQQENYTKASLDYDKSLELNPDFAEGHYRKGRNQMKLKKYDASIVEFTEAIKLDDSQVFFHYDRSYAYFLKKDWKNVIKYAPDVIKMRQDLDYVYYNLGHAYFKMGDLDNAVKNFKEAAALNKKKYYYYYELAQSYYEENDYKDALESVNDAIALDKNDKVLTNLKKQIITKE